MDGILLIGMPPISDENMLRDKIREVEEELNNIGLWRTDTPEWVIDYEARVIQTEQDFAEWLQFVFLPNKLLNARNRGSEMKKHYIIPQARKFFGEDIQKGKLLQLLIELDSIS